MATELISHFETPARLSGTVTELRPEHRPPSAPGLTLDDQFRFIAKLGEGGMGVVSLMEQTVLGRQVAVKTLDPRPWSKPETLRRFVDEAKVVAGLNHPNIVTVYDTGTDAGRPYFVMEYVAGETLKDVWPAASWGVRKPLDSWRACRGRPTPRMRKA